MLTSAELVGGRQLAPVSAHVASQSTPSEQACGNSDSVAGAIGLMGWEFGVVRVAIAGGCIRALLLCCVLAVSSWAQAGAKLNGFRMVQQENVMLHFDLDSASATAKLFSLTEPHRLVIDLPDTTLSTDMPSEVFTQGVVKGIRYAQHDAEFLRVVLDLRRAVSPSYHFVARQGGQRLIVDMGVKGNVSLSNAPHRVIEQAPLRNAVVVIDAGHGGQDPGAVGQKKTLEKDITLAIALRLYEHLLNTPNITPLLVRDKDVYVELRTRMEIARRNGADLFVSIHADAVERREANGSSVYALSIDGATSEAAALLAKSENEAAALYGNVELDGMDDGLRQTLLSLAQSSTMELSMEAGAEVLQELKQIGSVHKPKVEQAGFAVLKSPDVPSILVETAFISNRKEEKKLNSPRYQDDLARAIAKGVTRYLHRRAPEGTHLGAQRRRQGS